MEVEVENWTWVTVRDAESAELRPPEPTKPGGKRMLGRSFAVSAGLRIWPRIAPDRKGDVAMTM